MDSEETTEETVTTPEVEETEAEVVDETDELEDQGEDEPGFDAEKAREKIRKINSENRNLRKRAADAEAKAKDADEKGEQVTALEAENLKLRVAITHGLPLAIAKRLSGSTEAELLEDAEELMSVFEQKKPPTQQPKTKLRASGNDPAPDSGIGDANKLVAGLMDN